MSDLLPPSLEKTQKIFFEKEELNPYFTSSFQNSVFFIDLSEIIRQYNYWTSELPFVTPFYAIKCNPNPKIVELLARLGANFDCASQGEIEVVMQQNVSADRIIFANPIKGPSHIAFSKEKNVQKMTFDSIEEYKKIISLYPDAQPIIRIAVDDSQSICKFNTKFGAFPEQVQHFFDEIQSIGGNIYGVSFHVGSGCQDPKTHREAIEIAAHTILDGKKRGFNMNILDIGGGYPASDRYITFSEIAKNIREIHSELLEKYSELQNVTWIGEPGRYMVGTSHTMMTEVIGMKKDYQDKIRIYLNEGVYGSLSGIMFDYMVPLLSIYGKEEEAGNHEYTFFGPTCDSLDKIGNIVLPEIQLGDKIFFWHIGDYSIASASTFNGFKLPEIIYYISNKNDRSLTEKLSFKVL